MAYSNEEYKELDQRQMGTSDTAHYTVPTGKTAIIRQITIVNATAAPITVKLWHTNGAAGTDATLILPVTTILANGFATFDGVIVADAGDTIRALSNTASAATVTIYGAELT